MRRVRRPLGPAVIDLKGATLADDERARLAHPAVGGVILFSRNFESADQVRALAGEIKRVREPELLVCVDQEGGRVQRFREGFTLVPPMRRLGALWDRNREAAREAARGVGLVIGAELDAHGVDFSFTPVLDLDYGTSAVIGDRALHYDPVAVGALGAEIVKGLAEAGAAAVGKHFPGHGFAAADSHTDMPRDERTADQIMKKDVLPYRTAIQAGLAGIMPAHVSYTLADPNPAGFSPFWLKRVLRDQLGFQGLVFSDDLSMAGAAAAGGAAARADAALEAGCDMVLLCNDPDGQDALLAHLGERSPPEAARAERMRARHGRDMRKSVAYREALEAMQALA